MDFEEFCAVAISPYHLEALEGWEQIAVTTFEYFEQEVNEVITIEELAQAVYLKRNIGHSTHLSKKSTNKTAQSINESIDSTEGSNDIPSEDVKTIEEVDDDSDWINGLSGIKNILQDVIPGVKVKVLKVVAPGKVDRDLISKVVEQIIEDDEDSDEEIQDSAEEYVKAESDLEEIKMVGGDETSDTFEEQSEVSVRFIIGSLFENMTADAPPKDLVRVPAELEIRDHLSFFFSIKKEDFPLETRARQTLHNKIVARSLQRSSDHVRSDRSKDFDTKEKRPIKVLTSFSKFYCFLFPLPIISDNKMHFN
ncbi:hypothetical protein KSP40_PGU005966 [Platanthera guangdongensis]|uniref:Uncharacterized protein n=1 Tax=Platanthera guangdongensis TaxID=2320717 RepID=A0ABR2LEF9_9ASPA